MPYTPSGATDRGNRRLRLRQKPRIRRAARSLTLVVAGVALLACGERSEAQDEAKVRKMARELASDVERAIGLPFMQSPTVAVRTSEQVRSYLAAKLDSDMPPPVLDGMAAGYRLFGLLPDTLDLRSLLLSLYTEQVVGYYDPDSAALYVVAGADAMTLRMILAHELVHALQGQYLPLDSLLASDRTNDRRVATQAILEGQATLASIAMLMPDRDVGTIPGFWDSYRQQLKRQHAQMPVFGSAPLLIQESIVFPYLEGASFVSWFQKEYRDTVPFGPRLPQSTEHILHPDRYRTGDAPVELRLANGVRPIYTDVLGEFETRLLLTVLSGSEATGRAGARSWGGDRYAVYDADNGNRALVWWSVWDDERAADRFAMLLARVWKTRARPGRLGVVERVAIDDRPGVRLVDAPEGWSGWNAPPLIEGVR